MHSDHDVQANDSNDELSRVEDNAPSNSKDEEMNSDHDVPADDWSDDTSRADEN